MIRLSADAGILIVGAVVTVAVGWGAFLSVRSALDGPSWALEHLASIARYPLAAVAAGGVASFVFAPPWVGLAVAYIGGMVWWLAGMLRRNLTRLREVDDFELLPLERRLEIVGRTRRWMYVGGGALGMIGVVAIGPATAPGIVSLALAGVLIGSAVRIGADTTR